MSRAGFDTDEVRLTPDLGMLQGGGIFEAVTGDDPVIRIRRDHHDRGIIQSRSEERREGKECVSRVDLGGRRIIKKKTIHNTTHNTYPSKEIQIDQYITHSTNHHNT